MNYNTLQGSRSQTGFIHAVYGWMSVGLALTGAVAYGLFLQKEMLMTLLRHPWAFYLIAFAPIGLVLYLGMRLQTMSVGAARFSFLAYAGLVGVTMSTIFLVYTMSSIAVCFAVSAGMFGVMALYGYTTKADLSGFGSIMQMGLIGIIIASLVNMFLRSPMMNYVISIIGVLVFCGLTAYDMHKIKQLAADIRFHETIEGQRKLAIMCALTLYLDMINLFLFMLQFLGRRRD